LSDRTVSKRTVINTAPRILSGIWWICKHAGFFSCIWGWN
jgi:hypothetical protein